MLSQIGVIYGVPVLYLWFPKSAEEVMAYLNHWDGIVRVFQCSDQVALEVSPFTFRRTCFYTTVIDLTKDLQQIWSTFDKKSCRYEINKSIKIPHSILINERWEDAIQLVNQSIGRKRYRRPISWREVQEIKRCCEVFSVVYENKVLVTHFVLVDYPVRARLLLSATEDRQNAVFRGLISALNRTLHWFEIQYYKEKGVQMYDFGGIVVDPDSPLYSIAQFKLSFGGNIISENNLWLSKHAAVRFCCSAAVRLTSLILKIVVRHRS